jgi:elongation of very long chain fatty acids protein 6
MSAATATSSVGNSEWDYRSRQEWMGSHWHYSFTFTAAYLSSIVIGQFLMRDRKPFSLRGPLTLWNSALAIFSIAATLRTLPELIMILIGQNGIYNSVCSKCDSVSPDSAYWAWLFVLSKVVELGDTAFIVLRKQPLLFLHWYHHMTVLLYSWYSYSEYIAPARWFVVMNYLVHSLMYSYYALKSLRFRIPRPISMTITTLQLSQMVVGLGVNFYAYSVKATGGSCDVPYKHLHMGFCMYASYFALFAHFFYKAYFNKTKGKLD